MGSDIGRGLVHTVVVTAASAHDSTVMTEMLHAEESVVYGDQAYSSAVCQQAYEARRYTWGVNKVPSAARRSRRLSTDAIDCSAELAPATTMCSA